MPSSTSLRAQPIQPLDNPIRQGIARHAQRQRSVAPIQMPRVPQADSLDVMIARKLRQQDAIEQLHARFAAPISQWHLGVSRLSLGPSAGDATARHLKHLAKGSALFDQFCVGFSVDTSAQRIYAAFRLTDQSETAKLPDADTLSDVFCELAYHSPESSMYLYVEHEDGGLTWCDFGAEPVPIETSDMDVCADLLADYPDGVVLTFSYKLCFSLRAETLEELTEAVGVEIDGETTTRHHLTLPHRETAMNELTLEVGNYYRSLQASRVVNFVDTGTRIKRRAADKAKRKLQKKARRK